MHEAFADGALQVKVRVMNDVRFHTPSTYARNRLVQLLNKAAVQLNGRRETRTLAMALQDSAGRVQRHEGEELSRDLRELWAVFAPTGDFEAAGGQAATGTAMFGLLTALQVRR